MRHVILVLLWMGFAVHAREINISLHTGQTDLVLTNPSSITVNYDITCYTPDGLSNILALTNQNLTTKARVTHTAGIADSAKCASNANPWMTSSDANSKAYYYCSGAVTYANANNLCGTGNSFCFPDISGPVFACGCSAFWLKNDGGVEWGTCGTFNAPTGGTQVAVGTGSGNAKKTAATSPCSSFYSAGEYPVGNTYGAICCSAPVAASVCKVKINTTNPAGHLASPSFQGGAAF